MDVFKKLGSLNLSPEDLTVGEKYPLQSVTFVKTADFGVKLVASISFNGEPRDIYLPARFGAMTADEVKTLNSALQTTTRYLLFLGKGGKSYRYDLV